MKNKKIAFLLLPLLFMAQSCSLLSSPPQGGVVKSVNGGADWQSSNAVKDSKAGQISGLNIARLDFSPQSREVLYAGTYNGGLYKSEDSGATWQRILSKIFVYDFAVHPQDPKTIYVAGYYASHGKVLKTTDGGAAWQEIYNEASQENAVRAMALNPSAPNEIIIGMTSGNIIKSYDSGVSWRLANNFGDRVQRVLWRDGSVYVLLKGKGLMKSGDAGDNFQDLTVNLNREFSSGFGGNLAGTVDSYNQFSAGSSQGGPVYVTTSRGLYRTADEGQTWQKINLPVKSGESNTRAVSVAKSSGNLVFTSVGATIYKSIDGGGSWQTQNIQTNGFINDILIDPQLPQIVYAGIYVNQ